MNAPSPDARTAESVPVHAMPIGEVLARFEASADGLTDEQARDRLRRDGPNRLMQRPGIPLWRLALDEVANPLILILLGATGVLALVSVLNPADARWGDIGLILGIVVLNGTLGFIQNFRAQRGIEALQRLSVPEVRVLRGGVPHVCPAEVLVSGDVVLLEEGDRVPADGRLLRVHDLATDESSLTGESEPIAKATDPMTAEAPLAERTSMAFMGTAVASGRGRLLVTATGMRTEVGAIAEAVQTLREEPTPFQLEVAGLARQITLIIAVLIVVIAGLQLTIGGQDLLETFITAVALAVAAIPEGLPVVMTLALAFGTRRMLERRALVRSLPVVEIVGSTDVICTDKTGTITEGRMSLRRIEAQSVSLEVTGPATEPEGELLLDGRPTDQRHNPALVAAAVCNNAHHAPDGTFLGDPTEVALLVGALKAGVDVEEWIRLEELPFSSDRKRMSVVAERDGRRAVFAKGAPEVILDRCSSYLGADGVQPLDDATRRRIVESNEQLAASAFRVLALAGKDEAPDEREAIERDLVFYGLAAISDPPREAASPALLATRRAGIRVVMITGDNPRTAAAVGRDIGLEGDAITGQELERLSDEEIVERAAIFARVDPSHKLRILQALRQDDRVVVMTGDGVNDAPALKGADVGIAMGIRGTDVARDASDMVLLDDNFATIVAAVEEGRRIAANIKKFLNYLLTGNLAEVLLILVASLFGYLPISAVQILWVNLVTDSGPAVALAVDPAAPHLMDRPPRRGPIIGRAMLALIAGVGAVIAAIVLATFFIGLAMFDLETARTMTFTALVAQEYLRLVVIRIHEGASLLANPWLVLAVLVSATLQVGLIYSPLGGLFDAVPLGLDAWAVIGAGIVVGLPAALGVTVLVRRWFGPL